MSTGEDEPSSGLNGRLRPRKSTIASPQTSKTVRKPDSKPAQEKPKKTTTPSKVSPNKLDDLTDKSESPSMQILCPYCDKSFFSKQAISKHIRRTHFLTSKEDNVINCLFCNHTESDADDIIRHMVDNHPNQYFACYICHTRFPSTTALAEHKLNVCEKQKLPYRNKLRPKTIPNKTQKASSNNGRDDFENEDKNYSGQTFNSIVISCELKPSHPNDPIDIEDNITTNLILPSSKNLGNANVIEKNAIIVLDDLQWNKRIPPNFSFHNTDADQILSRLGVVHRSPRTGENNKKDWYKHIDESHQKFEKCFDTSFYSKVASNVQENLTKFLDGSFNFNPDPEITIKTRKAKNIVVINTVEGFPILLASEQFSRNVFDGYMPRTIAPKHKWKWENVESDKSLSPEQVKRDSHTNNCIITLVSSLDIWTQLCMRRKFEEKFSTSSTEKRIEKQSIIGEELKEILESRELPTSSQVVKYTPNLQTRDNSDFPASLGLMPNTPNFDVKPAVLSGEWVRPRCYVCCACGAQTRDSRALSSHISSQHPNAQIQHYEIVGEVLLNSDILKHLYVPPSQLHNRTRPLRGFRECTKCRKGISLEDLHQHMLDCAGDTPAVRRKCRYRPFGVRKRRPRLPDNTIRKEMRKDIRLPRHNRKALMRPRPKIRTEVGDAETIRKMLADLPAKRHRAIVNPLKPSLRPRRKLNKQRTKMVIKKRAVDEMTKKSQSSDMSKEGSSKNQELQETQKSSSDNEKPDNKGVQPISNSVKCVSSGLLNRKGSLTKKVPVTKNRRKAIVTKKAEPNIENSDVPVESTESDSNSNINQMSREYNSERVNLNGGPYRTREHGNSNNGSNNRDDQRAGFSGQNSNSRDSFAPSQNVPLKHSIARLTASSETHDKSIQFHHLFLVQQECNDTNQHLPSGQRILFENEAVVTKLDKPPLHFNHCDFLDAQAYQRHRLNKPRKGLNDCIAMLRNKLVEPNSSLLPAYSSVQFGTDVPIIAPEPVVIERRHSTTETNVIESAQRSLQMFYPNQTDDNPLSYDTCSRVTRQSSSRHTTTTIARRDKYADAQHNNDFLYWNQYYYNKQMMPAAQTNYKYNKREATRRRSVVSTEELLLQHAMNMELLATNTSFQNVTDYQYPTMPTQQKQTRRTRQVAQKPKPNPNINKPKPRAKTTPKPRQKKVNEPNNYLESNPHKVVDMEMPPIQQVSDARYESSVLNNTNLASVEQLDHYYAQGRIEDNTNTNTNTDHCLEKTLLQPNNKSEAQLCTTMSQNVPMVKYSNEYETVPVHYNDHVDTTLTEPLDLSNKTIVEDSRHYVAEEPYSAVAYKGYETINFADRYINSINEKETIVNNDKVVDLRVTYNSQPLPSRTTRTPLPNEANVTELSYEHTEVWIPKADNCLPTDLSVNRNDMSTNSYEKRQQYDGTIEMNMDISQPSRHDHDIRMIIPQKEDMDNEEPTDLSNWRFESRPNIPVGMPEERYLNVCSSESNHNEEEITASLSSKNRESIHNNYYMDEQIMPQYIEAVVSSRETGSIIDGVNAQLTLNSMDSEQMINVHYGMATRIPVQSSTLEDRTITAFTEPTLEAQNLSASNVVATSCELPSSIPPMNENSSRSGVTYLMSEVPLSYSKNTCEANIHTVEYPEPREREYKYEYNTSTYDKDSSSTRVNDDLSINSNRLYAIAAPMTGISTEYESNSSPITDKSNIIESRQVSSEREILEEKKHSSKETSPVPTNKSDTENDNILKEKNNKSSLDQDPETARKIAMLPKELVDILGNMPVDHRNQLLNVLPQYVSSSTSPVLLSNVSGSSRRPSIAVSANSLSPTHSNNQLEIDFKTGYTSEDGRSVLNNTSTSRNLQYIETSPTVVSSSILLTPPTPQLSDRHSNQSLENDEVKMIEYRRKSRISCEEETSNKVINSDNKSDGSYLTADEYNGQDRIIDLTGDEVMSENPDVLNNSNQFKNSNIYPSKDISSSMTTPKSKSIKTNSDKTASLRAVRIKTTSERQRSVLADNIKMKNDGILPLIDEEQKKKCTSEIVCPMAIQQAEITSTQHRPAIRDVSIIPEIVETCQENPEKMKLFTENSTNDSKVVDDLHYSLSEKQNVVTSSLLKESNCDVKDHLISKSTSNVIKNDLTSDRIINEIPSKNNKESNLFPENIENIAKNKDIDKSEPLRSPFSKNQVSIEDEDSEDDVTLAFIVKQKNRDLKSSRKDEMHHEKENTIKQSKKPEQKSSDKLPSDQQKQVLLSCNKSVSSEITNINESQLLKHSIESNANTMECSGILTKDKGNNSKRKSRRGRRVNILGTTQYVEQQETLCNTNEVVDIELEINKENNLASEIVKNVEIIDDTVKPKSNELDNNRSTTTNTVLTNEKEITLIKENVQDLTNMSGDAISSDNVITGNGNSKAAIEDQILISNNPKENVQENKLMCASENIVCSAKEDEQNINIYKTAEANDLKNQCDVNKTKESKDIPSNIINIDNGVKNKQEAEIDETIITSLRRSRRGKSLFIDSNCSTNEKPVNTEILIEQRAPLTKKQLIFSKLLQDEENHNINHNLITLPTKQIAEPVTNLQLKLKDQEENNSNVEPSKIDSETSKTNKRKKSPQSKRRSKKKKSLTNKDSNEKVNETQDGPQDANILDSNNLIPEDTISTPQEMSQAPELEEKTQCETQNVLTLSIDARKDSKTITEKRKSVSPDRNDLISITKPKKFKSNEEENMTVTSYATNSEKVKQPKENQNNLPMAVISRNATCYNKAIRRARSKSVVIKSSGAELYDPYDIDLEDMLDTTEPFVRKEISPKSRFSTFKPTVEVKTRKLSKTGPSAIIDILPTKLPTSDIVNENEKSHAEKIKVDTEYNNNSSITKDGSSDSDESSKSDVPLQKYVEEKEKKLIESSPRPEGTEKSNDSDEIHVKTRQKSKSRKKIKQSQPISNKEIKNVNSKTENEEELRSEQFMESFGFFSERKPRKSNLLATKKISETFNSIENDDIYFTSKERVEKKSVNQSKKYDQIKKKSTVSAPKKSTKRGRKKRRRVKIKPSFCNICKKVFRRWDNYVRHLLSLYHISRLCEIELKVKTVLIEEEPNYLLAYRQQLNRLKLLQNKIAKRKKNCLSTADIVLPTLEQILADVKRTIREQQLSRRSLSRDEALFIDCCEMLKESRNGEVPTVQKRVRQCNSFNCAAACEEELALLDKSIADDRCDIKDDEEMDSVAAKKILESEEVRNLENDLISNLKEANGITGPLPGVQIESIAEPHTILSNYEVVEDANKGKYKRNIESKQKMYPDIVENIDMFEDKFDKIKRKCRSQAAAAKQIQTNVESTVRHKNNKKSDKKKVNNKKTYNSTVPTKAALKGFDGVKVSILTSDINMSAITPSIEKVHRKKRKSGSKKKSDRLNSEKTSHRESGHGFEKSPLKNVDVYEFMDTEDTEVFEFRPSTLMERIKSINNKETPSTSKSSNEKDIEISSESGSDGDDFVYMSDDYVCSDDETENSMLSCELGNVKEVNEHNKTPSSILKRKETTEKNAVMGKIFKHNAVRAERKSPKNRELVKPKANLDQLFDSLLENEPKSSTPTNDDMSDEKDEVPPSRVYLSLSPQKDDQSRFGKSLKRYDQALSISSETGLCKKYSTPSPTLHPSLSSFSVRRKSSTPPSKTDTSISTVSSLDSHASSINRINNYKKIESIEDCDKPKDVYNKKYEPVLSKSESYTAPNSDNILRRRSDEFCYEKQKLSDGLYKDKSDKKKKEGKKYESIDADEDSLDRNMPEDAGVARQRARRKCTVGKQNVLAETWSSESEPDGAPPRPNSAESVVAGSGRKKKGRKKEGHASVSRKANRVVSVKKHEHESRVGSSNRGAGSGVQGRPRSPCSYWSEGDDEHPQQHGWIVGDSHKKLVTMLAHAKGRKRSSDEKRHLLE